MINIGLSVVASFLMMNLVTFMVYSGLAVLVGLQPPDVGSTEQFFISVLLVKVGLAGGFVLLFYVARDVFGRQWVLYATIWWGAYTVIELGQAVGPNYSWLDAAGGIIAEAIYFPASAWVSRRLLCGSRDTSSPP